MVPRSLKLALVLLSALALVAALACGGAEEETGTTTTAPADTSASTTKQTAAPTAAAAVAPTQVPLQQAAAVKEEQAPKPALATKEVAMEEAKEDFQYVPEQQLPGVYWDYKYTGPRPTEFGENPASPRW